MQDVRSSLTYLGWRLNPDPACADSTWLGEWGTNQLSKSRVLPSLELDLWPGMRAFPWIPSSALCSVLQWTELHWTINSNEMHCKWHCTVYCIALHCKLHCILNCTVYCNALNFISLQCSPLTSRTWEALQISWELNQKYHHRYKCCKTAVFNDAIAL